jgi:hypothetical protein
MRLAMTDLNELPPILAYIRAAEEAEATQRAQEATEQAATPPETIPAQQEPNEAPCHVRDGRTDTGEEWVPASGPDDEGILAQGTLLFTEEAARVQESSRDYRDLLRPVQRMLAPASGRKPAVCLCGYARGSEVGVHLVAKGGRHAATVSGIYRCGNGEACVFCAPRIAALRAERYRKVHEAVVARNGRMLTLTLTLAHDPDDDLPDLLDALKAASTGARSGGVWHRQIRRMLNAAGVMVDVHVRFSLSGGWHPHLHLTIPCLTDDEDAIMAGADLLVQRYTTLLKAQGYDADMDHQSIAILRTGENERGYAYPSHHHRPAEVEGDLSEGMDDDTSLSPFDVAHLAAQGDKAMEARFITFAAAMRGSKSAVVTARMAQALGIDPDPDGGVVLDDTTRLGTLPSPVWSGLLNDNLQGTFLSRVVTFRRQGWRYIWWWAHLQTGLAPPILHDAANELMVLLAAFHKLDGDDAKALAQDMIEGRIATWHDQHGPDLVAQTRDYAEAHYRYIKLDRIAITDMVARIERWADKLALRRRQAEEPNTGLPIGRVPMAIPAVPVG